MGKARVSGVLAEPDPGILAKQNHQTPHRSVFPTNPACVILCPQTSHLAQVGTFPTLSRRDQNIDFSLFPPPWCPKGQGPGIPCPGAPGCIFKFTVGKVGKYSRSLFVTSRFVTSGVPPAGEGPGLGRVRAPGPGLRASEMTKREVTKSEFLYFVITKTKPSGK